MKEIKITHETALKHGDLLLVTTFPFFDVAGIEVIRVFATPKAFEMAGDLERVAQKALDMAPKRFAAWEKGRFEPCHQFKFHYGFEIREDDKIIKVITILMQGED